MTRIFEAYLACSMVMAAITLLLAALSPFLGRRYKARGIYAAWLAVLLGLLVPARLFAVKPSLTAQMPASLSKPVFESAYDEAVTNYAEETAVSASRAATAANRLESSSSEVKPTAPPVTWLELAALIWLAGTAASVAAQLARHMLFMRTVRRWQTPIVNGDAHRVFREEARRLGVRSRVSLMLCPSVQSPMLVGLLRPKVLLPDTELADEELELVFRHELTHLKRRDLWIKAAELLATALNWYNPAAYLAARSLGFWQESACDERVTSAETQEGKRFYSETIIRVIRRQARARSAVTSSFYGGKNGMKRRIARILEDGAKRAGAMAALLTLAAVMAFGAAFAIDIAPDINAAGTASARAYVQSPAGEGAPMLAQPTVNDLYIPLAAYFNGTPVTIVERRVSSGLEEWGYQKDDENWARVLIGEDGYAAVMSGWIPLCYLGEEASPLPKAALKADSATGYVNIYTVNDDDAALLGIGADGETVTLLGRVQKWYQIEQNGIYGFVRKENLELDENVQTRLDTFRPDRYDTISRREYEDMLLVNALIKEKSEKYGGDADYENWSLEDKAWVGQLYDYARHDSETLYCMPGEDDLTQERADDIAWSAYMEAAGSKGADRSECVLNRSFYAEDPLDAGSGKVWSIAILDKDMNWLFSAYISSPDGKVLDSYLYPPRG